MNRADKKIGKGALFIAVICFLGVGGLELAMAATGTPHDFDAGGEKIFKSYSSTPLEYMAADSGDRNLMSFYELRQYPGSPPRIPHAVVPAFSDKPDNCLSCHAKGGYTAELDRFVPVTPHPENELCYQCHVPRLQEKLFVETDWESINPPKLGRSSMGGSPPPIPHSLQLRENCIACHTGPGAVVEIRVEHSSRGNCRQCHVPVISTEPLLEFVRNK